MKLFYIFLFNVFSSSLNYFAILSFMSLFGLVNSAVGWSYEDSGCCNDIFGIYIFYEFDYSKCDSIMFANDDNIVLVNI
jgi:hypothetical protein